VREFTAAGHAAEARLDVTDEAAVVRAFETFDARSLAVDILGQQRRHPVAQAVLELSTAEWRKVLDTNLTSAFVVGREAGRRMWHAAAARSSTSDR